MRQPIIGVGRVTPHAVGVYIGRGSVFGNEWSHRPGTKATYRVRTRQEAIDRYREWLHATLADSTAVTVAFNKLLTEARTSAVMLLCYCAPHPCHGDVIRGELLARLAQEAHHRDSNFTGTTESG